MAVFALLAAGASVTIAGLVWCIHTAIFVSRSERTEGEIVRFEQVPTRGGKAAVSVFSYRDRSGHKWEGMNDFSSATLSLGEKVIVVYDPNAPMSSSVDSVRAIWFGPGLILVWGLGFLAFAWHTKKKEEKR